MAGIRTANTTIQTVTPNYLRGRAMSVYLLVYSGGMPLGNLFAGGLAVLFGTPISFLIGGMLSLVAAMLAGFHIAGFWTAVGASLIVSLTSWIASSAIGNNGRIEIYRSRRRYC